MIINVIPAKPNIIAIMLNISFKLSLSFGCGSSFVIFTISLLLSLFLLLSLLSFVLLLSSVLLLFVSFVTCSGSLESSCLSITGSDTTFVVPLGFVPLLSLGLFEAGITGVLSCFCTVTPNVTLNPS